MHRSKLGGLIIDCRTADIEPAAEFWSKALGAKAKDRLDEDSGSYVSFDMHPGEPYVEVQAVEHESRVHIDIETDDVQAEVLRLEGIGAITVAKVRDWVVMAAPTGQKFCVVPVQSVDFLSKSRAWSDG